LAIFACLLSETTHAQTGRQLPAQQTPSKDDVRFPGDAGVVNVRTQYGAVGDGKTDDTFAIARAIGENRGIFQRILYFPSGTYIVSDTLKGKTENGTWKARLTLQGQNQKTTIIRLKDNLPEFSDPHSPKPVIQTGSIEPYNKQTGAGNNGFRNYILNITIDTGQGNPGAVGIDYLGNNICGLEDVSIRTGDVQGRGVAGLSMTRPYVGPCLYKRLDIEGFDNGVLSTSQEYSHTFEHLKLTGQHIAGINNSGNVLSIRDLESINTVPAIINTRPNGFITLVDSKLESPGAANAAIRNSGALLLRNITVAGYGITVAVNDGADVHGNIIEYLSTKNYPTGSINTKQLAPAVTMTLNLPIRETPHLGSYNLSTWINVVSKGARPDGKTDSTTAIQMALDSNADVVYLPAGNYRVTDTLHVRGKTQKILGLGAVILPDGPRFANADAPKSLLRFESSTSDISIDGIQFGWWMHKNYPGTVWLENTSLRLIVLEHVDFEGPVSTVYKVDSHFTGSLFIEDVAGFKWQFDGPQHVWARQFDVEGNSKLVVNNGAFLWILGMKTEGPHTVIETKSGGSTEVLGALLYPVHAVATEVPAFIVDGASAAISYVVSSYKPETDYKIQFQIMNHGVVENIKASDLIKLGKGSLGTRPTISLIINGGRKSALSD
jgi:hypothetical protein